MVVGRNKTHSAKRSNRFSVHRFKSKMLAMGVVTFLTKLWIRQLSPIHELFQLSHTLSPGTRFTDVCKN